MTLALLKTSERKCHKERGEFGACPGGSWGTCHNAFQTHDKGWLTMRCKVSGQHPDLCHNYSKPERTILKPDPLT